MKTPANCLFATVLLSALSWSVGQAAEAARPNVVLIMTDDQGYGDLGCTGNPIIKTPNIDQLASVSSGLSDYHVAPTCSPTRCSLLTGHWTNRTGVWHTIMGRSMLRENEVTVGQMFTDAGYETGMFGKWHLGDNYPYRPEDRGFGEVFRHGGGGVGQTPDIWNNAYFDGSYFHNGDIVPADGFCTDVFFDRASDFISKCAKEKKPFFAYITTNAPHGPLHCPQKYLDMYEGQSDKIAAFFGMITNVDDNVGKTRKLIKKLGIADDTIFIFTTDNGTASGAKIYNAGMRAGKGSPYDGGHRVPFFLHWPAGGITKQHNVKQLAHAVDIVPTLLEMTGVKKPQSVKFDGVSIADLLDPTKKVDWTERFTISDSQRVRDPIKWRGSSVMSQQYRLVKGKELYDITVDPGQKNDIATANPEVVAEMREFYDAWWAELEPTFSQTTEIYLGHPEHPIVSLTAHDWIQKIYPPWHQGSIRSSGRKQKDSEKLVHKGHWAVKVIRDGKYQVSLRRWPVESGAAINAALPAEDNVPGATQAFRVTPGKAIGATHGVLRINGKDLDRKLVGEGAEEVSFVTELKKGSHQLAPYFEVNEGELGAYYVIVAQLDDDAATAEDKSAQIQAPVADIQKAAAAFLEGLSPELRKNAMFTLDDQERRAWSNLPATSFKREGVSFKEMSPKQRTLAHQLLQSTLSSQGYLKTSGIMHLDEILKGMAAERRPNRTPMFGHDLYWIGIFGDPAKDKSWGWQLDGHHLALNITVVDDEVSVRPAFMGSDPAKLPEGAYAGWHVQRSEDEKGRKLFKSLNEKQRTKAIIDAVAPRDVITGPTRGDQLKTPTGLPASELNASQRRLLKSLLEEYTHNYEHNIAHIQMDRIMKSGLEKIHFAWAGTEENKPYYYRIHGPTVIIEFDNHYPPGRNTGPINHIHTVFREPGNDYGEDLLRKHLLESPHHQPRKSDSDK